MDSPKSQPEVLLPNLQFRVAWNEAARKGIRAEFILHETRSFRIARDILKDFLECRAFSLIFFQNVVIAFALQTRPQLFEDRIQLLMKEAVGKQLVGLAQNTDPKEMDMIGHAAINGTRKGVA